LWRIRHDIVQADRREPPQCPPMHRSDACSPRLAQCFLRLANLPSYPLDRLSRYEAALWRQACQTIFAMTALQRRKPWEAGRRFRPAREPSITDIDEND
jgi:hypothetical protein